jgi:hypothetical protein
MACFRNALEGWISGSNSRDELTHFMADDDGGNTGRK